MSTTTSEENLISRLSGEEKVLSETYKFTESSDFALGEGAYGIVFRGRSTKNDKDVAVKRMLTSDLKEDELAVVRQLNNPFLVSYLDVFVEPQFTYIVMEVMEQDLTTFIANQRKLAIANMDTVAKHIAQGYLALYEKSIVHRDIKPSNILLKLGNGFVATQGPDPQNNDVTHERCATTGQHRKLSIASITRKFSRQFSGTQQMPQPRIATAKITDFGTSRQTVVEQENLSNLAGTMLYMAPEVGANLLDRNSYGSSVDMWSIGVVIFESLTGSVPFDEAALCKMFLQATTQNYLSYQCPPMKEGGKNYQKLAIRLLTIDPDQRLKARPFHDFLVYNHPLPAIEKANAATAIFHRSSSRFSRFSFNRQQSWGSRGSTRSHAGSGTGSRVIENDTTVNKIPDRVEISGQCEAQGFDPLLEEPEKMEMTETTSAPKQTTKTKTQLRGFFKRLRARLCCCFVKANHEQ